jgi:signal peptidase I
MKEKSIIREIRNWVLIIIVAFALATLFSSKVFAKVQVQQGSMENTLFSEQQLIVDKFSYNFTKPKRGDIVIFLENEEKGSIIDDTLRTLDSIAARFNKDSAYNEDDRRLVKRVIGVEGDEVDIKDGFVYLNGEKFEESYTKGKTQPVIIEFPITVGKDQLFVLGDNRMHSTDSREFGFININQVEGRAVFRVYPFDKIGSIK